MTADSGNRLLQDRVLAHAARRGERSAFDELYRRHAGICWRVAMAVSRQPATAARASSDAFASTLTSTPARVVGPTGDGPRAVLLALLRTTRQAAVATSVLNPTPAPLPSTPTPTTPADRAVAAFAELPERARTALWLVDVERFSPGEAGAVVELSSRATGALVERARLGLREQMLLAAVGPAACRRTVDRLPAYAAGILAERDELSTRRHLDACPECRGRLEEIDDVPVRLRRAVPLAPALLHDDVFSRWTSSMVALQGPLHLRRPGGRPVPVWMERAVAGAVAAAIAVGVSGAIIAGGRSRTRDDAARPTVAEASLEGGDGEVALGAGDGLTPLVLDQPGFVPPSIGAVGAAGGPSGSAPVVPFAPASPTGPTVASAGTSSGSTATGPTPSGPAAAPSTGSPSVADPPAATPPTPPAAEVTVGVGDTLAVTVGDACTGLTVLGTSLGCAPATTQEPLTLDVGGSLLGPLGL
jgi:DNA-directed RNA polymerase specialized sigma24 family protein